MLTLAACTTTEDPPLATDTTAIPVATTPTQSPATTETPPPTVVDTTTTKPPQPPDEVTTFTETLTCDPEAEDADVQVVQAFITAYNQRDAIRLHELIRDEEIWDIGGVPHLGTVLWTDAVAWAENGWLVNDKLRLTRVVRYGPKSGSDVTVLRTNDVLTEAGIDELELLIKVPSSGCIIDRLIAHVSPDGVGGCSFYQTFINDIRQQETLADLQVPERCTASDSEAVGGYTDGECEPTIPLKEFVPPQPYAPSRTDGLAWYGTNELWTALDINGDHSPRKSVWWSENFRGGQFEASPVILVEWTRLDADAPIITNGSKGTNAFTAADGSFIIGGIDPDIGGCWRVTATYKGASMSYVYERS